MIKIVTAFDLNSAVLIVEWVVMKVHHAGQRRGKAQTVLDAPVTVEPHQRVPLRHVV